jgi:hypothetical protein
MDRKQHLLHHILDLVWRPVVPRNEARTKGKISRSSRS